MPSDSGENRRSTKPHHQQTNGGGAPPPPPPPEHEHLPCPRCESTNTKFCYYNNYNFSQPRHFCKSCRRYWTHGGTLRDIPVGGGSRKNAKRSRTCSSYSAVSSASGNASSHDRLPAMPVFITAAGGGNGTAVHFGGDVKGGNVCGGGSFTSLLHSNGPGFLALGGGFGIGLGPGFDDVRFGLGKVGWPFSEVGSFGANSGGGSGSNGGGGGSNSVIGNTWQLESGGEGGFVGGDCFAWPDLAISTPGNGLK